MVRRCNALPRHCAARPSRRTRRVLRGKPCDSCLSHSPAHRRRKTGRSRLQRASRRNPADSARCVVWNGCRSQLPLKPLPHTQARSRSRTSGRSAGPTRCLSCSRPRCGPRAPVQPAPPTCSSHTVRAHAHTAQFPRHTNTSNAARASEVCAAHSAVGADAPPRLGQ